MLKFVFIIPTRNSSSTLHRALESMTVQSYKNWRAIVIDDCSTDNTSQYLMYSAVRLGISNKIKLIKNEERMWEIANIIQALQHVEPDEIVCRLDFDDYLCDLNALEIIAKQYETDPQLDVVYTAHRWFDENGITTQNISGPMPQGVDVYKHPWCASHFKTFRKNVLDGVSDANYRGVDGQYFKRIGDQAFMLPALHRARKHKFVPIAAYAYYCPMMPSNFQTEDAKFQKEEAEFLRSRGFVT